MIGIMRIMLDRSDMQADRIRRTRGFPRLTSRGIIPHPQLIV